MKFKVLLLGPSLKSKGGISSVLNNYLNYPEKGEIEFFHILVTRDKQKFVKIFITFFALLKMIFLLAIKPIDIVHAHPSENNGFYRYIPFFLISKIYRKKVIFHIHGGLFDQFFYNSNKIKRKLIKLCLSSCDLVICLSQFAEKFFNSIGIYNTVVLPNTVNVASFNPYCNNSKYITFLGFIEEQKGVYDLIDAFSICESNKYLKLNICGSGDIVKLKKKIQKLKLDNQIIVYGWVNSSKKDEILRNSLFLILPSYNECLPMVILEAMANGLPIITTPVGGIPELVNDSKNGIFVQPGNIQQIANAIDILFGNKEYLEQISRDNYSKIVQFYSMQVTFHKLNIIYNALITKKQNIKEKLVKEFEYTK